MSLLRPALASALASLALCGCHSTRHAGATRGLDGVAPVPASTSASEDSRAASADASLPRRNLTLPQAIGLALERHPALAAQAWELRRTVAEAKQAGRWSNPTFSAELENFGGSGAYAGRSSAETTLSLAQAIPIGGDLGRRRELAQLQSRLASWDYEAARLALVLSVTEAFVAVRLADKQLELARQDSRRAAELLQIARQRIEAGEASPVEQARATVELAQYRIRLERTQRLRSAASERLAALLGEPVGALESLAGDLEQIAAPPAFERLAQALAESPEVARWATEISARVVEGRIAKAEAWPDLEPSIGWRRFADSDDTALVAAVSLPLPLFDRRQDALEAARHGEQSAHLQRQAAELRVRGLLADSHAALGSAFAEASALREQAIPAARRATEASRQAYDEGEVPLAEALEAQQLLTDLQAQYWEALAEYHARGAEIEALLGRALPAP